MPINRRVDYNYISSPEWRANATLPSSALAIAAKVRNRSSSQVQLDAHHRTYERLGNEKSERPHSVVSRLP